ncbi:hypothetical protein [Bradyrhizobium sp.]|uniref:hypothetical protein n=2 Tax=Nitrobacteraceae TaxID=41294 RepID=UPI00391C213F
MSEPVNAEGTSVDFSMSATVSQGSPGENDRVWTATAKHKLKGLAKQNVPIDKIARTLKRSVASTEAMIAKLGVSPPASDRSRSQPVVGV